MIAIVIALLLMLTAAPAFGQFGGSIVSDPPTEQATAQTSSELNQANAELQQDIKDNSLTAASRPFLIGSTGISMAGLILGRSSRRSFPAGCRCRLTAFRRWPT
jgi:hypothetical protein